MEVGKKIGIKSVRKLPTRNPDFPSRSIESYEMEYEYTPETKLIIACKMGNYDEVIRLISINGVDPSFDNNKALERACENGRDDIAKYLLQFPGVSFENNSSLDLAKQYKHTSCIALAPNTFI
jgi:ankyrin repeat protein